MTVSRFIGGLHEVKERWGSLVASTMGDIACPRCITQDLVCARIWYETRGNPRAVSKPQKWGELYGGEVGLLQLSPTTREAAGLTVQEAMDPATNLRVGIALWCRWVRTFLMWCVRRKVVTPELNPVGMSALAWLVTAIGPGAIRYLAASFGGDPELWPTRMGHRVYAEGVARGKFGSQSAGLIRHRVQQALQAARAAQLSTVSPGAVCLLALGFLGGIG